MSDIKERPNRYPLPPLMTLATLAICYVLDKVLPLGWEPEDVSGFMRGTGLLLIVVAIAIDVWALRTFRRHNANIMPHKAASQILMDGPFAHSRNPIYFANVMLTVGAGFLLGSRWFLIGAAVLFVLLSEFAVKREERHMAALFKDQWDDYCKSVRRWV
ncbi:MAG: isoprenylcysteine carboxylmethyltransferase family protein [Pseudomonadota bacterium]